MANANKVLKDFKYTFTDDVQKDACLRDMFRMNKLHGFEFSEYLYYHFYNREELERLSFISYWEHLGYACVMNRAENNQVFDNKWLTYCHYKKFFGRDVL